MDFLEDPPGVGQLRVLLRVPKRLRLRYGWVRSCVSGSGPRQTRMIGRVDLRMHGRTLSDGDGARPLTRLSSSNSV